jgi:catechol 2,3-dioxygenase-like lactoylglutathione lyase family enzyme
MPLAELGHVGIFCSDMDRSTRFCRDVPARQPFLVRIDLASPIGELPARNGALVERYGASGYLEPGLVDNLIPDEAP